MPSSNLTANSIAPIRRKYAESSGGRTPGSICAATPETFAIGVDRRAEDVAVVELRPPAEVAHRVARSSGLTIVYTTTAAGPWPGRRRPESSTSPPADAGSPRTAGPGTAPRAPCTSRVAVSPVASETMCSSTVSVSVSTGAILNERGFTSILRAPDTPSCHPALQSGAVDQEDVMRLAVVGIAAALLPLGTAVAVRAAGPEKRAAFGQLKGVNFVSACGSSHRAADDPIVAPRRPGTVHTTPLSATDDERLLDAPLAARRRDDCRRTGRHGRVLDADADRERQSVEPRGATIYCRRRSSSPCARSRRTS